MTDHIGNTLADVLWAIYSKAGETPDQFVANARTILAALKAARIAVVELNEADSTRYDEGEDAEFPPADRLAWLRGMGMYGVTVWPECPGEVQVAYNNEPGEPLSVDEARSLAAALLAAAEASQ
ncbi:hypothetical protein AB0876_28795 [Mycobacterium sp. NPDC049093]